MLRPLLSWFLVRMPSPKPRWVHPDVSWQDLVVELFP